MTGLVHRQAVAFLRLNGEGAHAAEQQLVACLLEVLHGHGFRPLPRRQQGRFVHQIPEIRPGEAGGPGGDMLQVHIGVDGDLANVDL